MRCQINGLYIRFLVHATEDPEKVEKAIFNLLPGDYIEEIQLKRAPLKGHYGNPIFLYETKIRDREKILKFIKKLSRSLTKSDKAALLEEADLLINRGNMFLRLDKQAAFKGEYKLCKADPFHIRIRFKASNKENIVYTCRELGLMP